MIFLLIPFVLAGVEPFLPFGSLLVSWASVVGVKRTGWFAVVALIAAGFVRDIVLVKTLGESSLVLLSVWMCSGFVAQRFHHPFLVAVFGSIGGGVVLSVLERQSMFAGIFFSSCIALVFSLLWERCSQEGGITLRNG